MAEKRIVFGSVRVGTEFYAAGQEDKLEPLLTADQVAHLKAQGAIEGDWSPGEAKADPADAADAPADDLESKTKAELERQAADLEILDGVQGTGSGGNVLKSDLVRAIRAELEAEG